MRDHSVRKYSLVLGALAFAFVLAVSGAAYATENPDQMILVKNKAPRIDDNPKPHPPHRFIEGVAGDMILVKNRATRVDDNPKPHPPNIPHNLIQKNYHPDGMVLAKGGGRRPPAAPPVDAPIKHAPHPPGAVHG